MSNVHLRLFAPDDRHWVVAEHAKHYALEAGFDGSFGPLVANVVDAFMDLVAGSPARGWIAEDVGNRIGCVFCVPESPDVARLRLFFLLPEARGLGVGRQLLSACMDFANSSGYARMVLSTHESHETACRLYKATGWVLERSAPVRSFGQDLIEQDWTYEF